MSVTVRKSPGNATARWVALAALLGACGVTESAAADEPVRTEIYDPGEYPPPAARWGLLLAGAGTTAAWYGGAVGFSYLWPDAPGALDLRIPIAGPWMALSDTGCADDEPDCSSLIVVLRAILTTIDGIGQAGGLAVMGEALFLPTAERRSGAEHRRPLRLERRTLSLSAVPLLAGRDGVGVGVVGEF